GLTSEDVALDDAPTERRRDREEAAGLAAVGQPLDLARADAEQAQSAARGFGDCAGARLVLRPREPLGSTGGLLQIALGGQVGGAVEEGDGLAGADPVALDDGEALQPAGDA